MKDRFINRPRNVVRAESNVRLSTQTVHVDNIECSGYVGLLHEQSSEIKKYAANAK